MTKLVKAGYLYEIRYGGSIPLTDRFKEKKHEYIYCLDRLGIEFAKDYMDDPKFPRRKRDTIKNDYVHRITIGDTLVSFSNWLGDRNGEFLVDHHRNETVIPYEYEIKPDAIIRVGDECHLVEIWTYDKKGYPKDKIINLFRPLQDGAIQAYLECKNRPNILNVCENEKTMRKVIQVIQDEGYKNPLDKVLYFATIDQIDKSFNSFKKYDGTPLLI